MEGGGVQIIEPSMGQMNLHVANYAADCCNVVVVVVVLPKPCN